ncbi:hypothetical protein NY08_3250 [Rhodococcus sp. B7740]|nr:hypothetical protein NY08_3250 [Rhodococcus sp. B7740]
MQGRGAQGPWNEVVDATFDNQFFHYFQYSNRSRYIVERLQFQ